MECELLASLLKRSRLFDVVGTVTEVKGAHDALESSQPDVVVISSRLQDGPVAGFQVLEGMRTLATMARSVLLLDTNENELVIEAFRKGAHGVFTRADSIRDLPTCLQQVHKGQMWADSSKLQLILEALMQAPRPRRVPPGGLKQLHGREEQIALLVAEGLTNREVSRKLNLSEHTVKNHLFHIFDKLGVSSRAELIIYVLQQRGGLPAP